MPSLRCAGVLLLVCILQAVTVAQEAVFSGPQVGEPLPSFTAKGALGEKGGQAFDVVKEAKDEPVLLFFVHARTRPAFGLMRVISQYAAGKAKAGLHTGIIFLTDDPTATEKWMNVVEKQLPKGVQYGISTDGQEGPGAYGLNRNVTLTVLVGNEGKVTANFALIQPQLQADGPKILKAIVDVTGGGKVPTIEELGGDRYAAGDRMAPQKKGARQEDPELTSRLRAVLNKQADAEQVKQAVAEVEKYVAEHETARKELGRISSTVVGSDKLANYGTAAAQDALREWAKKYGDKQSKPQR